MKRSVQNLGAKVKAPPGGCYRCFYWEQCHHRQQANLHVWCEVPDADAGIDSEDWWPSKARDILQNVLGGRDAQD